MLKFYLCFFFVFILAGCENENPVENLIPENQILNGSFKICYVPGTPQENIEEGSITIVFENNSYHYTGNFADTTKGRGYFFKDGIHDKGNCEVRENNISLKDYAVTYGLESFRTPSLFLNGDFEIKMIGRSIFFIQEMIYKQTIIVLRR